MEDSLQYFNEMLAHVESNHTFKKMVTGVAIQTAYTATGAVIGGVVLGPPGALVGSIGGAVVGYCRVEKYPNLYKVLKELNDDQKKALVQSVIAVVGGLSINEFRKWFSNSNNHAVLQSLFVAAIALAKQPISN
ncbi:unnamed protein product [Caenorhabditis sp. 36 PRJEB53466]|nr:unnamed protein product [Caenorhabditis sp. 36 PRJEB53466]